ncbi:ArsR/SmtB family transcription factor [Oerskovia flava]|uniref:ArsR/SmtB family transcription factor n=1 Tax=Oerskovia flava TaxID=2986422 RepID=UPI0022408DE3|nr:helix-turn-helix domain-containing protein [Oerskovia sp. JB1-3-2]
MNQYAYDPDPENAALQATLDEMSRPLPRAVLRELATGAPLMSGELAEACGAHQHAVLYTLRRLERLGLVTADHPPATRVGRRVHYRADQARLRGMLDAVHSYLLERAPA